MARGRSRTRSRSSGGSIDDSGFHSQSESQREQVLGLLEKLLESGELSVANSEEVATVKVKFIYCLFNSSLYSINQGAA